METYKTIARTAAATKYVAYTRLETEYNITNKTWRRLKNSIGRNDDKLWRHI